MSSIIKKEKKENQINDFNLISPLSEELLEQGFTYAQKCTQCSDYLIDSSCSYPKSIINKDSRYKNFEICLDCYEFIKD